MDVYIPREFPPELVNFIHKLQGSRKHCRVCRARLLQHSCIGETYLDCGVCSDCARGLGALFSYRCSGSLAGFYQPIRLPLEQYKRKRVPLAPGKVLAIFERDGYRCLKCGKRSDLTIDHIIPWVKGGTNDPENLQTLCRSCNAKKADA